MGPFNLFNDNQDSTDDQDFYDDEPFVTNTSFDPYSGEYSEYVKVPNKRPYDNSRSGPKWTPNELLDTHLAIMHSNTPTEFIAKLKAVLQ